MSRFPTINPDYLPALEVLEDISAEDILARRMSKFVEVWAAHDPPAAANYDVAGLEFDPIKITEEAASFSESLLRDRVNQATRAVTLAYAIGSDLDAIGTRYPGGMPRLAGESDDRYRRRVWLSPNPLSVHGTSESYQFWALTAVNGLLRDASVVKIRPSLRDNPIILISCLMPDMAEPKPTRSQLLQIRKYIQDEGRLALTDVISVSAPKVIETDYHVKVKLFPGPDAVLTKTAIETSVAALVERQFWLGYDHTRDALATAARVTGVHSVEVVSPSEDVLVAPDWIVRVRSTKIEIVGGRFE